MSTFLILIAFGLPAVALSGIGAWTLRRESTGIVRGIGYLLIAMGIILAAATVVVMLLVGLTTTGSENEIY